MSGGGWSAILIVLCTLVHTHRFASFFLFFSLAFLVFLLFSCVICWRERGGEGRAWWPHFRTLHLGKWRRGPLRVCVMGLWFTHGSRPSAFELSRSAQIIFGRPDGLVCVCRPEEGRAFWWSTDMPQQRAAVIASSSYLRTAHERAFDGTAFGLSSTVRRYLILGCALHELTYLFISPDPVAVARNDWERSKDYGARDSH
jgi:hypothetical protein